MRRRTSEGAQVTVGAVDDGGVAAAMVGGVVLGEMICRKWWKHNESDFCENEFWSESLRRLKSLAPV